MPRSKLSQYQQLQNYHNIYEVAPWIDDLFFTNQNTQKPVKSENIYNIYNHILSWKNPNKIVLELCCAAGDYMIWLSQLEANESQDIIYIWVEIKWDRILKWTQLIQSLWIDNIYFVRCDIRQLMAILPPHSIDEIRITFPDPQPWHKNNNNRVTNDHFLSIYAHLLKSDGILHIKSDDPDFVEYTRDSLTHNHWQENVYIDDVANIQDPLYNHLNNIITRYESRRRRAQKKIYYIQSKIPKS